MLDTALGAAGYSICDDVTGRPDCVPLVAVGYWSKAPRLPEAGRTPPIAGISEVVPTIPDFATPCLAFGIGAGGSHIIEDLASAAWFSHLPRAVIGLGDLSGQVEQAEGAFLQLLGGLPPRIVSIALSAAPTPGEIDLACQVGNYFRCNQKAVVVMTCGPGDAGALLRLGRAADCLVRGDGSLRHHHYPIRTVSEPGMGRLVCYDLYDVICAWAGRVGQFGMLIPQCDALHVEISARVPTLQDVDDLANGYRSQLNDEGRLVLFNVVDGADLPDATPISFVFSSAVQQDWARGSD